MAYQYYLIEGKTLSGSAFHSVSTSPIKVLSLEKPLYLGNFYHTINLKAKTKSYEKDVRRA
jgi:hypothetical protein